MNMQKEILLLTKSAKNSKYCVAGIDLSTGKSVRIVSSENGINDEITDTQLNSTQPLDVVNVEISKLCPLEKQPENILIAPKTQFKKIKSVNVSELEKYIQHSDLIFNSTHNRVSSADTFPNHSLMLVHVQQATLCKQTNDSGSQKTKISFRYNKNYYSDFSVTDPAYYICDKIFDNLFLVISLPNNDYHDSYYKLVAKIFEIPQ